MNPPTTPTPQPDPRDNAFNASIGAIILIAIGAVLFLDNLGLVPFANIRAYWPLAISARGIALLSRTRRLRPGLAVDHDLGRRPPHPRQPPHHPHERRHHASGPSS